MNWQQCVRCGIYFDQPNYLETAKLCPDCWKFLPHYRLNTDGAIKTNHQEESKWLPHILSQITFSEVLVYIIANAICVSIILYYLWFK